MMMRRIFNRSLSSSFSSSATERRVGMIAGDGIGAEVTVAARRVLDALNEHYQLGLSFIDLEAGWDTFEATGTALPERTVKEMRQCQLGFFGAVQSPVEAVKGYSSPIVALRKELGLFANLRPLSKAGVCDFMIVRENTEDLYVKREHMEDDGNTAVAEKRITRAASERIAHAAFQQARKRAAARQQESAEKGSGQHEERPPMVTIVHKSNVLSMTDGLFRSVCFEVGAKHYPDVIAAEQIVDSMVYKMILAPEQYDVVVAPNLYGDILSDAGAALAGGLGLVASLNAGDHCTLAEPVHGSAPDIAGKGIANPIAAIRCCGLLVDTIQPGTASLIESSINQVLADGNPKTLTPDLGGTASTTDATDAVLEIMSKKLNH